MLFQGQEFAASSPFLYFADHEPSNDTPGGPRELRHLHPESLVWRRAHRA
jgi:1,4-alpha-glucan branching enzyme